MYIRKTINILGMQTDVISTDEAVSHITDNLVPATHVSAGKYICVSNVHMCMECFDDPLYNDIVNNADLVCPDGRPIAWAQTLFGTKSAKQVRGYDITLALCKKSAELNIPVGFYGASEKHLEKIQDELNVKFPNLNIDCAIAPPFRKLTTQENQHYINTINNSGIKILFVGLGCPKQERWMAEHKNELNCVMLGVGAVFDFISGEKKHAPRLISHFGLEWLFRLACEPRRLFFRYMKHNPRFLWYLIQQYTRKVKTINP